MRTMARCRNDFRLNVIQFPTFGECLPAVSDFDGRLPRLVYVIDGSNVTVSGVLGEFVARMIGDRFQITCRVRSIDSEGTALQPRFSVDGVVFDEPCRAPFSEKRCRIKSSALHRLLPPLLHKQHHWLSPPLHVLITRTS